MCCQMFTLNTQHKTLHLAVITRLAGWKKMRPDMMIVEMTDTEQRTYLPHDTNTGSRPPVHHAQRQSKESYNRGGRLLQRCLIFRKGQGERLPAGLKAVVRASARQAEVVGSNLGHAGWFGFSGSFCELPRFWAQTS